MAQKPSKSSKASKASKPKPNLRTKVGLRQEIERARRRTRELVSKLPKLERKKHEASLERLKGRSSSDASAAELRTLLADRERAETKARRAAEKASEARSKAARKGARTKKKKKLVTEIQNTRRRAHNVLRGQPKAAKKHAELVEAWISLTPDQRSSVIALRKAKKATQDEFEKIMATHDWVNAMPLEYQRFDGSIAVFPSRARHMGAETQAARSLMAEYVAKYGETRGLAKVVPALAEKMGVTTREIYTLFYSP